MNSNKEQQSEKKDIISLIDKFDLKELPAGVQYMIKTIEQNRGAYKFCDGDIENIFAIVRQGYGMENKKMPDALTQQTVRDFYNNVCAYKNT